MTFRDIKEEDKKKSEFIHSFNLPRSKFIFRPDKVVSIKGNIVTLKVTESSTNMSMSMNITKEMFEKMCDSNPEKTAFLMENYYKEQNLLTPLKIEEVDKDNNVIQKD